MCGRYVQTKKARDQARFLAIREEMEAPRPETWNLAPSTRSLVVRAKPGGLSSCWLLWGFGVSATGALMPINAWIETAASKSLFRDAWKTRRCVIPADGWYEWQKNGKQAYYFYPKNGKPLFFGGLWAGETFVILTTAAEGDLAWIHDRRPLAFGLDRGREWLEKLPQSEGSVVAKSVPSADIAFHPVSERVSSPRNDGPELIQRVAVSDGPSRDEFVLARANRSRRDRTSEWGFARGDAPCSGVVGEDVPVGDEEAWPTGDEDAVGAGDGVGLCVTSIHFMFARVARKTTGLI